MNNNRTIFDGFTLDGIDYYRYKGKYYADNMTIRKVISIDEYRSAMLSHLIQYT
jgi:hypothetical protein